MFNFDFSKMTEAASELDIRVKRIESALDEIAQTLERIKTLIEKKDDENV